MGALLRRAGELGVALRPGWLAGAADAALAAAVVSLSEARPRSDFCNQPSHTFAILCKQGCMPSYRTCPASDGSAEQRLWTCFGNSPSLMGVQCDCADAPASVQVRVANALLGGAGQRSAGARAKAAMHLDGCMAGARAARLATSPGTHPTGGL